MAAIEVAARARAARHRRTMRAVRQTLLAGCLLLGVACAMLPAPDTGLPVSASPIDLRVGLEDRARRVAARVDVDFRGGGLAQMQASSIRCYGSALPEGRFLRNPDLVADCMFYHNVGRHLEARAGLGLNGHFTAYFHNDPTNRHLGYNGRFLGYTRAEDLLPYLYDGTKATFMALRRMGSPVARNYDNPPLDYIWGGGIPARVVPPPKAF